MKELETIYYHAYVAIDNLDKNNLDIGKCDDIENDLDYIISSTDAFNRGHKQVKEFNKDGVK